MLRRMIDIHRSSSPTPTISRFLQFIFLLHTCTALFTIVNALQQNDNEAIIQLSVDSIHVVKTSDKRFTNIEENLNDNEEKNLLRALLNSFDDQTKSSRSIKTEEDIIENIHRNDLSSINNCSSRSESQVSTSSPIRFIPSSLDFDEQSIAIPCMQTVMIINDHFESLELYSLSGTTVQFYSSFFTQKILPAHGGNTTIRVYYLPRTIGRTKSTFTIQTSHGTFQYYVNGIGKANPFRLRPLIGATIPLNSTYEYSIQFHNPYNYSIDIEEIYTSDENLLLDISSKTITDGQWHFEAYQTKSIVKISYFAWIVDRLHAFYCIKTNANDTIIVPVEIQVENQMNLYSNVDRLEFSPDNILRSNDKDKTIPVYVINHGKHPVTVSNIRVTTKNINYVSIHYENVLIPPDIHRWNKVAELTLHLSLISDDIKSIDGTVQIYTLPSINDAVSLEIPFHATILHGSLEYDRSSTYFFISSSSLPSISSSTEECRLMEFTNRFNVPITIFNISTDKSDLLSQYIKMKFFAPYVYLQPGQTVAPLCITALRRPLASVTFTNFEAHLTLNSNLSAFHIPIYLYSGLLSLNLITDNTNGGIRRSHTNLSEFFIASIPVHSSRTVKFILINTNPIDINIERTTVTYSHTTIQLFEMQSLNGSALSTLANGSFNGDSIESLVIPARHQAVLAVTIQGISEPSSFDEILTFQTSYEILKMNIKYQIISGSINLNNDVPLHIDVFPNRIGTIDLFLHNGLNKRTDVTKIEFPMYGRCFSFTWNNTGSERLLVEPKQSHHIGKLSFDMIPLCDTVQIPSESTCYCGLKNHPEFKQIWDEHVSMLDTDEFDYLLVSKFRSLWNEWTSFVRNQKLETNIWLTTDQANISWPITIGFVWPSVLEHMSSPSMSRTPIILNYDLTLINTTKTHDVIINNPSSTSLSYVVELINNYQIRSNRNRNLRHGMASTFQLSTSSNRVDWSDSSSRFVLQPNEHMIFKVSYQPTTPSKDEVYLVIRNNLTIIESILLTGESVSGSLTVGNRKAGSSNIPIVLEMNEKQYKFCSDRSNMDGVRENPKLDKIVKLRNTGNVKVIIHDVYFGNNKCSGQGFSVNTCSNIELDANENYDLIIYYQPDYLLPDPEEILTLDTNIGRLTYPVVVRIPKRVLATCFQHLPRPAWESHTSWLCICSLPIILIVVIAAAISDARQLLYHYWARLELQDRSAAVKQNIFNLKTFISTPAQPEICERVEATPPANTMSPKKDGSNHDHKPKINENKSKRSTTTVNGNKDNGETVSKTVRTPESSNPPPKPVAVSPKAVTQKPRRGTIDNGPSKAAKYQNESTNLKPVPLRPQKSVQAEQSVTTPPVVVTPPAPAPLTVPSTPETDNESEPFMIARPKRVSTKVKESTNNGATTKLPLTDNPSVPIRSVPSPPTSVPPTTLTTAVVPKISVITVTNDQPEAISEPTNPNLDESWHMVSSNRTQRKSTSQIANHRRENNDEVQTASTTTTTTTKRNKSPPTNNVCLLTDDSERKTESPVEWDEPRTPDHDFTGYVSPTESIADETSNTNDWSHGSPSTLNDLPSLLTFSAIPAADLPDNNILKPTATISLVPPEDIEPIPYLHHGPGPIQRPNKLNHATTSSTNPLLNSKNSLQSPGTADVLDHLNRFIYADNEGRTPTSTSNNVNSNAATLPLINDLTPSNMPWSFSSTEWSSKLESSWALPTLQSPNISLSSPMENPFTMIPQASRVDPSLWSSATVGIGSPRFVSPTTRTQRASAWNDFFSSTVPSATTTNEMPKMNTDPWAKYMAAPDPSSTDVASLNEHDRRANNSVWPLPQLSTDSVVPTTVRLQQGASTQQIWWRGLSSDENNNTNHRTDNNSNTRDQSRWDFAR